MKGISAIPRVSRGSLAPASKGIEPCLRIAALSALLAGIVYSAFSAQRLFFPLKTVPLNPNASLENREIVPISNLAPAEIAIQGPTLSLDPAPLNPKENLSEGLQNLSPSLESAEISPLDRTPQDPKKAKDLKKPVSLNNGYCRDLDADRIDDCFLLSKAVQDGNLHGVLNLIQKGTDVNNKDEEGFTPLVRAVLPGEKPMISYLIGDLPGKKPMVSYLIGDLSGKKLTIDYLIENRADLQIKCHGKSPWEWAKDIPDINLAQFLEDSSLFLNGFRRAKQTGNFSDVEIILGANPKIADSFHLIVGYRDTSLLDLQLGEMFLQQTKDIECGRDWPSVGTSFSYSLSAALSEYDKNRFRDLLAEGRDLFQISEKGISSYGHIVRYKYPDTDAFPFMQIWTGTENHRAFASCRTISDFFEKVFPVDRQKLLEWRCEKLPDLSVLNEEIYQLVKSGAILPSEENIPFPNFFQWLFIRSYNDRLVGVRETFARNNPLFAKIWEKANVRLEQTGQIGQLANHQEQFKNRYSESNLNPLYGKGIANLLCSEAVLGLYSEALKKIEEEAKDSREKYVYEWVAVMKEARDWMARLGYPDGLEFEKFMDVSAQHRPQKMGPVLFGRVHVGPSGRFRRAH